jgi:hypothetical protein
VRRHPFVLQSAIAAAAKVSENTRLRRTTDSTPQCHCSLFFSTACGTADNRGDMSSSNIFFTVLCSTSKLKHYQFCNLIRWWWARSENDRKHKRFFLGNSYRGEPIKLYITISLLYCCSFGRASASTTFGDGRKESLKLVNVSSSVFGNWCVQEPGHPRQAIASGSGRIIYCM